MGHASGSKELISPSLGPGPRGTKTTCQEVTTGGLFRDSHFQKDAKALTYVGRGTGERKQFAAFHQCFFIGTSLAFNSSALCGTFCTSHPHRRPPTQIPAVPKLPGLTRQGSANRSNIVMAVNRMIDAHDMNSPRKQDALTINICNLPTSGVC